MIRLFIGGDEEDRTPDLRIANATLSQLSYAPSGHSFYIKNSSLKLTLPERLRIIFRVDLYLLLLKYTLFCNDYYQPDYLNIRYGSQNDQKMGAHYLFLIYFFESYL